LNWDPSKEQPEFSADLSEQEQKFQKSTLFLGFTSNMISSGVRESIKFLVKHRLVDVVVTTAGGVEEDLMKCLAPHIMGEFHLQGSVLREQGVNRIGNILVPNNNYCKFEDWIMPILDKLVEEQKEKVGFVWTPSRIIERLGLEINHEDSMCYWAAKVFSLTLFFS
jgi:deoxyhypusine synthase